MQSLTLHPDHDAEGLKNLEQVIGGKVKSAFTLQLQRQYSFDLCLVL